MIPYDRERVVSELTKIAEELETVKSNKKIEYYNIEAAFDIETTSFYSEGEKQATMYEWTFGIGNDFIVYGRTWARFLDLCEILNDILHLSKDKRLIIYVHNLAFEFQFLKGWFEWIDVFALDMRKPVFAATSMGIEFRCSCILSGYSLESLGKNLTKYPVEKMVGDLDYTLARHSDTPLTEKELGYCENDVKVVLHYIRECIETEGNITNIPLTKTGYVRRYCRHACLHDVGKHKTWSKEFKMYHRLMQVLTLTVEEYLQMKRAFQGGFTHANAFYTERIMENVGSYDFTSSYPAVMVAEQFPMSRGELVEITTMEQFEHNLKRYCCLFDIEIQGLRPATICEHPLSKSRCFIYEGAYQIDNGRVVSADRLRTTITEQDYYTLKKFYKWDKILIGTFRRYKKGYLPTDLVKAIIKLYNDKTTLKGVKGEEINYQQAKANLNSIYGMSVTSICRPQIDYKTDWTEEDPDYDKEIADENKSFQRFLFYGWGVWVTAYARRNLFSGIYEFGNDYIYSDTDSIKAINCDKHQDYINRYNKLITTKVKMALKYHGIPEDQACPKTIKGVEKPLGVWDFECTYDKFVTLGAKRYAVQVGDEIDITVAGVNKKAAVPYLIDKYGKENFFKVFVDGLTIDAENTGKLTHTYIDDLMCGTLKDYNGVEALYYERSGVHLEGAEYNMSICEEYRKFLYGIREMSI